MKVRYLAYGSNLHPLRLRERVPSARLLGTARVTGWSLSFTKRGQDGSGKCTISESNDSVSCAIYEMTRADKTKLDDIEGVGRGYLEHVLCVPDFGDCATYVAEAGWVDESLLPFCWYRDLVVAGAVLHGFDERYLAHIGLQEIRVDADSARRAQNERLLRRLNGHEGS